MKTFKAKIEVIFKIEDNQAPEDFISALFSESLVTDNIIEDWNYVQENGVPIYPQFLYQDEFEFNEDDITSF